MLPLCISSLLQRLLSHGLDDTHKVGIPQNKRVLEQDFLNSAKSYRTPNSQIPAYSFIKLSSKKGFQKQNKADPLYLPGAKWTIAWKQPFVSCPMAKKKISWIRRRWLAYYRTRCRGSKPLGNYGLTTCTFLWLSSSDWAYNEVMAEHLLSYSSTPLSFFLSYPSFLSLLLSYSWL